MANVITNEKAGGAAGDTREYHEPCTIRGCAMFRRYIKVLGRGSRDALRTEYSADRVTWHKTARAAAAK